MAETPEVCEQLHLPLQSGSDRVLRAMRRGYTAERYLERLAAARAAIADLAVTTDIIVGFPGETDEDFEDTLAVVRRGRLRQRLHLHLLAASRARGRPPWSPASCPPTSSPSGSSGSKTVVDRSALARHQARVGRSEEVLVEGVSRRDESMLDRAHPAGQARPLRRAGRRPGRRPPGALARVTVTGGAPAPPLRPAGGGGGAAPASRAASRWRALDRGRAGRRHRLGQVGGRAAGWRCAGATARSSPSTRCASTAAWTSGRRSPAPRRGPPCRTTCSTWSTRPRSSPSPQFQRAARRGAGGHRATRPSRPAGRRHRALPARRGRRPRDPGPLPRRGGRARGGAGRRPGRTGRPARPAGRARPGGRGADGADQPPTGRAGPRGDARLGPALLVVRSRARGLPGERHGPGRACPSRPRRSTAGSTPASPHGGGRPGRRGAGAGRPPGRHVADGPPGPRLPGAPGPRGGRGAPWPTAWRRPVRRTRQFARRQASWFRRDPRIRWAGSSAEAQALLEEALAVHG